jgi:putative SOS response-associated peptidase YedK
MCGRYTFFIKKEDLEFKIENLNTFDFREDYNISPEREILGIIKKKDKFYIQKFIWGLIPKKIGSKNVFYIINSRKESLLEKDMYIKSLKNYRCLILASGFYEWKNEGISKIPYYLKLKNNKIMYFAGIYKLWNYNGNILHTCSIITVNSNEKIKNIHDRMPAILDYKNAKLWLEDNNIDNLMNVLKPIDDLEYYEVNKSVGNISYNSIENIIPFKNDYKLFE